MIDSEITDKIGGSISLQENKEKDSIEPDDCDADCGDEDEFENVNPEVDAVDSVEQNQSAVCCRSPLTRW